MEIPTLKELTLQGWDLSSPSFHTPLAGLVGKLEKLCLRGVTLGRAVGTEFLEKVPSLTHFVLEKGALNKAAFKKMFGIISRCRNLEVLNLRGNRIGEDLKDTLTQMVLSSPSLKWLTLSDNQLFDSVTLQDDLPIVLAADPLLAALASHPNLKGVDLTHNGPYSMLIQDHLDSRFQKH